METVVLEIMTQEEKRILLKDLCGRLPYGVKVCARFNTGNRYTANVTAISVDTDYIQIRQNALHVHTGSSIEDIRPYLRPMFSMTEEECKELGELSATIENVSETLPNVPYYIEVARPEQIDWLNEHHFDYRGLIEKGLALEAKEGVYD